MSMRSHRVQESAPRDFKHKDCARAIFKTSVKHLPPPVYLLVVDSMLNGFVLMWRPYNLTVQ